jgi:release factor glutamine methyltransferase
MIIKQALIKATKKLSKVSSSANLDAEILLMQNIKYKVQNYPIDKTWIYTHSDYKLSKSELKQFQKLISRRFQGEPIAYILGHKEFYGLDFLVNENVLVPRPETEIMVEQAIQYVKNQSLIVADIGTGSGCIAVLIGKNCPNAKIYASDISKKAITIARKNARLHQVLSKIKFKIGESLPRQKFDIVLANLPYLRNDQIKKELLFEPDKALYGGLNGTTPYQKLFSKISNKLNKKYLILIEIDPDQVNKLKRIAKRYLDNPFIKVLKDYSGSNRFLKIISSAPV